MKKIIYAILILTMIIPFQACGKEDDSGLIVPGIVGDTDNDTGKNKVENTNNNETNTSNDNTTNENSNSASDNVEDTNDDSNEKEFITGGFVTENGDVFVFDANNEFNAYLKDNDTMLKGVYVSDWKSYITLNYNTELLGVNNEEETEIDESRFEIVEEELELIETIEGREEGDPESVVKIQKYKTKFGDILVRKYDEHGEIVDAFFDIPEPEELETETGVEIAYENMLTYEIKRTTTTDIYENEFEVLVLSKGSNKIILYKEYDLE